MSGSSFKKLVLKKPKNYTVVAMLTALGEQYQCDFCQACYKQFELLAKSYQRANYYENPNLFFVLLDVDKARDVFQSMKIQTVPHIFEFPNDKTYPAGAYDIRRNSFEAESIAEWIQKRLRIPKIKVVRPVDYVTPAVIGAAALAVLVLSARFKSHLLLFFGHNFWAVIVLAIIFTFTSGQMWNKIQSPPMVYKMHGETTYIFRGSDMQLYSETFIVAGIYACFSVGMILMNFAVEAKLRRRYKILLSFSGLVAVVVFYSLILSIFRSKNGGYPYRCLFA